MNAEPSIVPWVPVRRAAGSLSLLVLVLALPWAGCGGSGGGSPTDPAGHRETEIEYLSLDLVNQARRGEGVEPQLAFDARLVDVARAHSEAMRDQGFIDHVDPSGHDFGHRLRQAGVTYTVAGENLAVVTDSGDPAHFAHRGFLGNPAHRANMLDRRFTHGGVGVAYRDGTYWITQLFVRR